MWSSVVARRALFTVMLSAMRPSVGRAHFLFARLDEDEKIVKVYFAEPVEMVGDVIMHVKDRVNRMIVVGPEGRKSTIDLEETEEDPNATSSAKYLSGRIPDALDNTPFFVTGFLDYGDFGEGEGPKKDLQYTFSAQLSSTNPNDDFSHFLHSTVGTDADSPYAWPDAGAVDVDAEPFAIALKNFGPPYRVVMRGVGPETPVRACLYDGNGSNQLLGCVEGTHNRTHHMTLNAEDVGVLTPCGTYFALANTTIPGDEVTGTKTRNAWSSTSVVWNAPCIDTSRRPVPQWYEDRHFDFRGRGSSVSNALTTNNSNNKDGSGQTILSSNSSLYIVMGGIFATGLLVGGLAFHVMARVRRTGGGEHSKITSADADDVTAGFSDKSSAVVIC